MFYYEYGMGWGFVCVGPLGLFKMTAGEDGIRSPLIVSGPGVKRNRRAEASYYVTDIMPSVLEMAGIQHP
jgi:arylsulfatase A-like enzyme